MIIEIVYIEVLFLTKNFYNLDKKYFEITPTHKETCIKRNFPSVHCDFILAGFILFVSMILETSSWFGKGGPDLFGFSTDLAGYLE